MENVSHEKSELFFSFFFVVVLPLEAELIQSGSLRLTSGCCCSDEVPLLRHCDCEGSARVDCQLLKSV